MGKKREEENRKDEAFGRRAAEEGMSQLKADGEEGWKRENDRSRGRTHSECERAKTKWDSSLITK